jgi:hypothetical protein
MFRGRLYLRCFILVANLGIVDIYLYSRLPKITIEGITEGKTIVGFNTLGNKKLG